MNKVIDSAFTVSLPENVIFVLNNREIGKFLLTDEDGQIMAMIDNLDEIINILSFGNSLLEKNIALRSLKSLPIAKSGLVHSIYEVPEEILKKYEKKIQNYMKKLEKESIFMYSLSLE
ncbi:hypothetical protein KGV55_01335 [Candidatus Gracilibacteria bacterium]|nr:hypothetical protein [Candidatus Gracilibacteria bacterium]